MNNPFTKNSLKRKNHTTSKSNSEQAKEKQTSKRVDTILDTVQTEDIASMLRFILHEDEIVEDEEK